MGAWDLDAALFARIRPALQIKNFKKRNDETNATKETRFVNEKENNDGEKVVCSGIISVTELLKEESEHKEKSKQVSAIFTAESEAKAENSIKSVDVISGLNNMSYDSDEVEHITKERHDVGNALNVTSKNENNTSCLTVDEIKKHDNLNITKEDLPSQNKMADISVKLSHDDETKTNSSVNMVSSLDEVENKTRATIFYISKNNPYVRVLKNRKFIFFLLGTLFYSVPEEIIYMLYPNYAVTNGSSQSEMSNLLSIIGIFSTITRLLMGITANSKIVDISILFAMPFVLLGVATLLLPYYVHGFTGRVFYAIVFGLYNSGVSGLLNELVSKTAGDDNVTAAFGLFLMLKGIAGVFAPPLADAIQIYAGNPDASFVFAGSVYTMCLLMIVLLP